MEKDIESSHSLANMLREELKRKYPMSEKLKEELVELLKQDGEWRFTVENVNRKKFAIIDWAHENGLCAYDSGQDIVIYVPSK